MIVYLTPPAMVEAANAFPHDQFGRGHHVHSTGYRPRHQLGHQSVRKEYRCISLLEVVLTACWTLSRSAPSRTVAVSVHFVSPALLVSTTSSSTETTYSPPGKARISLRATSSKSFAEMNVVTTAGSSRSSPSLSLKTAKPRSGSCEMQSSRLSQLPLRGSKWGVADRSKPLGVLKILPTGFQ